MWPVCGRDDDGVRDGDDVDAVVDDDLKLMQSVQLVLEIMLIMLMVVVTALREVLVMVVGG